MNKKIAIFVPARLSSERLPNKQILPIGNTCMFEICCKKLQILTEKYNIPTYVLINDEELINIANKYNAIKIIIRDKETTQVDGPLTYIFKDVKDIDATHLMFLNPCVIMLSIETILYAIETFLKVPWDYATSVKPFTNWLFDAFGNPLTSIDYEILSTKDIKGIYQCAHCFHIFNKEQFFKDGQMLKPGHGILTIPQDEIIDIDNYEDYDYACFKWNKICN